MEIISWNLNGLRSKAHEVSNILSECDILCLTETKMTPQTKFKPVYKNFNYIRKDREADGGGGLMTIIHKSLTYSSIVLQNIPKGVEVIGSRIVYGEREVNLFNVYIPPQNRARKNHLSLFFEEMAQYENLIISGDLNAHHSNWGSDLHNARGDWIADVIINQNLKILNSGEATRELPIPNRKSVPDISISSNDIGTVIRWELIEDLKRSDHLPMKITVEEGTFHKVDISNRIGTKRVDWALFRSRLNATLTDSPQVDGRNFIEEYNELIIKIRRALEEAGALMLDREGRRQMPRIPSSSIWWDQSCREAVDRRRIAYQNYRRDASDENWDLHIKACKDAKKLINDAKERSFGEFCESLSPSKPMGEIWKSIRGFKNRALQDPTNSRESNDSAQDPALRTAFNKLSNRQPVPDQPLDLNYQYDINSCMDRTIKMGKLTLAIEKAKEKSAPGLDHISYAILKQLPESALRVLLNIFNEILTQGKVPDAWKSYKVCFIPKPEGKGFRPIAMSCCTLKILERIINDRMTWWVESSRLLPDHFNGFRRGKSCYDNLADLKLDLDTERVQGLKTGVIFLDIQGAYDNVNVRTMLEQLKRIKLPPKILKLMDSLLAERNLHGFSEGRSLGRKKTNKGLPQGSILSPLLFNIYMSDIEKDLPGNVKLSSFADDFRISSSNASMDSIKGDLSSYLTAFETKLEERSMSISFPKCHFLLFNYKNSPIRVGSVGIPVGQNVIYNEHRAKYLGVTWDIKLNWEAHVTQVKKKAGKLLNILSAITNLRKGAHPETVLLLYKGLVRPGLEWAGFLFNSEAYEKIQRLNVAQNTGMRKALGCISTTPINTLLHLSGLTTLRDRLSELSIRFLVKKVSVENNNIENKLKRILALKTQRHIPEIQKLDSHLYHLWLANREDHKEIEKSAIINSYLIDYDALFIRDHIKADLGRKLKIPEGNPQDFRPLVNREFPHHRLIYTDGSLDTRENKCGLGIIFEDYPQWSSSISLNPKNSIYGAEMQAIRLALSSAVANEMQGDLLICTDFLSSVLNLKQDGINTRMTRHAAKIRQMITEERRKGRSIVIMWIPAHCGIEGNEAADRAAKLAAQKDVIDLKRIQGEDLNPRYRSQATQKTGNFINQYAFQPVSKGYRYILFSEDFKQVPWFKGLGLDRKKIGVINRLMTGHTLAKAHLKRMNILEEESCECGEGVESIEHIFWFCPNYARTRYSLHNYLESKGVAFDTPIDKIVIQSNLDIKVRIASFFINNKIRI